MTHQEETVQRDIYTRALSALLTVVMIVFILLAVLYALDMGDESAPYYIANLVTVKLKAAAFAGCAWAVSRGKRLLSILD